LPCNSRTYTSHSNFIGGLAVGINAKWCMRARQ